MLLSKEEKKTQTSNALNAKVNLHVHDAHLMPLLEALMFLLVTW